MVRHFVLGACLAVALKLTFANGPIPQQRKVYLSDNEVWIANPDGSQAAQLTHDAFEKSSPVWSPNAAKILYYTRGPISQKFQTKVAILGAEGKELKSIVPVSQQDHSPCTSILNAEWIGDDRVGIECHINPSLSEYFVMDASSGKSLGSYLGFGFRWSPDGRKLAHVGWIPHFADPEAKSYYLQIGNKTVYPPEWAGEGQLEAHWTEEIHEFSTDFSWSLDSQRVAFIDKIEKKGNEMLVIAQENGSPFTWGLPPVAKGVQRTHWLDDQTLILSKGRDKWSFNYRTRQLESLSKELKTDN